MHPDLKIKIPRRIPADHYSPPYWDLVRKHGKSRKAMVNFICGIGGYSTGWGRQYSAIEFNVKAWMADLTPEHLWKLLCSDRMDFGIDKFPPEHLTLAKALFLRVYEEHKDHVWEWGCEEAYEGWKDSDTPYETFAGERIDWVWEIHGRSSGHLCMTRWNGLSLMCSTEELRERLEEPGNIPHRDVRGLFLICVQNVIDFTPRRIADEVEYRAAWRLWVNFCEEELKVEVEGYENRENLSEEAGWILSILKKNAEEHGATGPLPEVEAFEAICKLADVRIGEV